MAESNEDALSDDAKAAIAAVHAAVKSCEKLVTKCCKNTMKAHLKATLMAGVSSSTLMCISAVAVT